ncbi:MAG: COP23 domain-containing protein [Synechococcales bacterium]|nr:COP23 domain-containing protein [Synechococcales bacterium]
MRYQFSLTKWSLPIVIGMGLLFPHTKPAQAQASEFFCGNGRDGVAATMARTKSGNVPVIRFRSEHFSGSGWTPERRCHEVSQRFERFRREGTLKFLTTGRKNGYGVICVASERGGACLENGLLLTVRPNRSPSQTLYDLLAVRDRAAGPLNETTARPYISVEQLIEQSALDNSNESSSSEAPVVPSKPASDSPASGVW